MWVCVIVSHVLALWWTVKSPRIYLISHPMPDGGGTSPLCPCKWLKKVHQHHTACASEMAISFVVLCKDREKICSLSTHTTFLLLNYLLMWPCWWGGDPWCNHRKSCRQAINFPCQWWSSVCNKHAKMGQITRLYLQKETFLRKSDVTMFCFVFFK